MVFSVEVYPGTRFLVSYILRDLAGNLLRAENWIDVEKADTLAFRLYIDKDRFFPSTNSEEYIENDSNGKEQAGTKITFLNHEDLFTEDDIGRVFTPQITIIRNLGRYNEELADDQELTSFSSELLQLTVTTPKRLVKRQQQE